MNIMRDITKGFWILLSRLAFVYRNEFLARRVSHTYKPLSFEFHSIFMELIENQSQKCLSVEVRAFKYKQMKGFFEISSNQLSIQYPLVH